MGQEGRAEREERRERRGKREDGGVGREKREKKKGMMTWGKTWGVGMTLITCGKGMTPWSEA